MKIIFMGTPSYATKIFEALVNDSDIEVLSLITQPDKPVGRKQILTPPNIKKFLLERDLDIEILQPTSLKEKEIQDKIKSKNPDFIVVAAYGKILPKEILDTAPCINLHASILPKYRGASPIQEAILHQDKFTGVTAMKMDIGLDTGDILGYSFVKIADKKVDELFEELSNVASSLTIKILKNYHNIKPTPQISSMSSHCKKIKKSDALVDLKNAKEIYAKFKAFYFWPNINLESGLKIKEMKLSEKNGKKNEILEIKKESIVVGCKNGAIEIFRVQPPSKKEMSVVDYIRGKRVKIGDLFL